MNGIIQDINSISSITNLDDIKNLIANWNPKTIKISSYTVFNSEYSKILANEKYQHDDRILLFNEILNKNNDESNYEININKNFVFQKSEAGV